MGNVASTGKNIAVIGAGPMGLMCGYELLKRGHNVTLYEADDRIGGMSACFALGEHQIERYYHFITTTDYPLFDLLKELDLYSYLTWHTTRMGFYWQNHLFSWGDPISLLRFPGLRWHEKLRYGLHVLYSKYIKQFTALDKQYAIPWLKDWLGEHGYAVLWDRLFALKFHQYQSDISAAWIAARIQRLAKSRTSLMQESLGYLQGGSNLLLAALEKKIYALGGKIHLNTSVQQLATTANKVVGVHTHQDIVAYDTVISTIPLPYVGKLAPTLPESVKQQINSIAHLGVVCVVLQLKKSLSDYFWININDSRMDIPGIIEYSNLNPTPGHIVYIPYYLPLSHPHYQRTDADFLDEVMHYLKMINPLFSEHWVLASKVSRYACAQTVCSPGFYHRLPPMQTAVEGFYMADTAYYYPEDRTISESVKVGAQLARLVSSHGL